MRKQGMKRMLSIGLSVLLLGATCGAYWLGSEIPAAHAEEPEETVTEETVTEETVTEETVTEETVTEETVTEEAVTEGITEAGTNPETYEPNMWAVDAGTYTPESTQSQVTEDGAVVPNYTSVGTAAISPLNETTAYNQLMSMQASYPEGMYYTNSNTYSYYYHWTSATNYVRYSGGGCAAFAFLMSDSVFGSGLDGMHDREHTNWDDIRVGDILRINNDTHSVIVLRVSGDNITVAEGNYNSSIHWGRVLSRASLKSGTGTYIWTRWPEGSTAELTAEQKLLIMAFIYRAYDLCLGRDPDSSGLQHWYNLLTTGQISGAEMARRFVFSTEYTGKNTTDEAYVKMLYKLLMNRTYDSGGLAHWKDMLNQGLSREYVFRGFAMSTEYSGICTNYGIERGSVTLTQARDQNPNLTKFVNRLYTKALGRNGEVDGLNHWCATIQTGVKTPEQVAESFICSTEFKNKNLSDEAYIKTLYLTFMGRDYDAAGLAHWKSELARGCSRENILHRFANSTEFKGIMAQFGL